MAKLYTPLRIAAQISYYAEEKIEKKQNDANDEIQSYVNTLVGREATAYDRYAVPITRNDMYTDGVLNLDSFLSWCIGSTFCKRSYNGPYETMNKRLLEIYNMQKQDSYKKCRKKFRDTISFATIFRCWMQHKQVYRFDNDFIGELMQTDTVQVPVEVLKRLPFRCFYLDLEETDRFNPFIGVFVYIGFDEKTALPNLCVYRIAEAEDRTKDDRIYPSYASGPEMRDWGMLVTGEDGNTSIQFTNNKSLIAALPNMGDKEVFDVYMFVLQAMLYLSTNDPDTMASPKRRYVNAGKRHERKNEADLTLTDVGVRYGTAIRKIKKQVEKEGPEIVYVNGKKARRPITSHVRCAHWHHYWVGKGRTERIVKWVPPTFVSGTGKELPVTIHKVGK